MFFSASLKNSEPKWIKTPPPDIPLLWFRSILEKFHLGVGFFFRLASEKMVKKNPTPLGVFAKYPCTWRSFHFILFREGCLTLLIYGRKFAFLKILKMLYPPEGLCWAEPEGGPIVFTLHFIGVGRGTGGFNFSGGNPPFWNLENVLSPGGTLLSRARKGSNCFYFTFFWCRKRYWGFQFQWR